MHGRRRPANSVSTQLSGVQSLQARHGRPETLSSLVRAGWVIALASLRVTMRLEYLWAANSASICIPPAISSPQARHGRQRKLRHRLAERRPGRQRLGIYGQRYDVGCLWAANSRQHDYFDNQQSASIAWTAVATSSSLAEPESGRSAGASML